jgi:hypothetical protein
MKVLLDTNVLIAALITRGVCSDLLEHFMRLYGLVTSEFILGSLNNAGLAARVRAGWVWCARSPSSPDLSLVPTWEGKMRNAILRKDKSGMAGGTA